ATPWKATLTTAEASSCSCGLLLLQLLPGILDGGAHRLDLDVGELPVDLLHLAQVLVLHDVARLGIDGDRPARAVRILPVLEDLHGLLGIELALLLLDRLDDDGRAVVGARGDEIGRLARAILLLPGGDELLVRRTRGAGGI